MSWMDSGHLNDTVKIVNLFTALGFLSTTIAKNTFQAIFCFSMAEQPILKVKKKVIQTWLENVGVEELQFPNLNPILA